MTKDEEKTEKTRAPRRTIVEPPKPSELGSAREELVKEPLLNNSKAIRTQLVAWDTVEPLEVPVQVESEIEADLLAKWYEERGYVVTVDDGVLTFDPPAKAE